MLAAFYIGWFFFERKASEWLEKIKNLLEKMKRQQQEGYLIWAKDVGHTTSSFLSKVSSGTVQSGLV
jgi:hypothetical protein